MLIEAEALERWPHLQGVYHPGQRLAPAEIMQHFSGRVRGGLDYCAACNGFFQGLLADITKRAFFRVQRECYDRTYRIPAMMYPNSRPSEYAGGPSPLVGSTAIGFFHDEIFCEHPESMGHDGATRVSDILAEEMMFVCPDVAATVQAEPTLMYEWCKQAAIRRDASGRLTPWVSSDH